MGFNFAEKDVFIWIIGLIILGFYFYCFANFLQINFWLIFCFIYIAYFVLEDGYQRLKNVEKKIKIIDTKDRRIDFWH